MTVPMNRSLLSSPSIKKLFSDVSCPLMETEDEARRSSGRLPLLRELGGPSFAPGAICASRTKFRPLSGRSCMALASTSTATEARSV